MPKLSWKERERLIAWEVSVLEMWLKLWKEYQNETWYRDARDHIYKLRKIINGED